MRQALVAESSRRKIHDTENKLSTEIDVLENKIQELESQEKDIKKVFENEREEAKKEHEEFKKEMGLTIYQIKDEIDTLFEQDISN
jgi:molecular chaperone GrpE (heat shock protein)